MKLTCAVDSRGFNGFVDDLVRRTGKSRKVVVRNQVGRVLSTAVKYTKKASVKAITAGARKRQERIYNTVARGVAGQHASNVLPRLSRTSHAKWIIDRNVRGEVKKYRMDDPNRRWSDERWQTFQELEQERERELAKAIKRSEKSAKDARGLAAREFVEMGKILDIPVKAPAFVLKARPSNGKTYNNASAREISQGDSFAVEIETNQPTLVKHADGAAVLSRAVKAAVKSWEGDIRRGVFEDAKTAAQRYPGLIVLP